MMTRDESTKDETVQYCLQLCIYIYIYIASMNPSEEAELDHILAGMDYTECDEVTEQPGSTPEFHE